MSNLVDKGLKKIEKKIEEDKTLKKLDQVKIRIPKNLFGVLKFKLKENFENPLDHILGMFSDPVETDPIKSTADRVLEFRNSVSLLGVVSSKLNRTIQKVIDEEVRDSKVLKDKLRKKVRDSFVSP